MNVLKKKKLASLRRRARATRTVCLTCILCVNAHMCRQPLSRGATPPPPSGDSPSPSLTPLEGWEMSPDGVWYRQPESGLPALRGARRGTGSLSPSATFMGRLEYDQYRRQQRAKELRRQREEAELAELAKKPAPTMRSRKLLEGKGETRDVVERMAEWDKRRGELLATRRSEMTEKELAAATFKPHLSSGTKRLAAVRVEQSHAPNVFRRMRLEDEWRQRKTAAKREAIVRQRERELHLNCTFQPNRRPRLPPELVSVEHSRDDGSSIGDDDGGCEDGHVRYAPEGEYSDESV